MDFTTIHAITRGSKPATLPCQDAFAMLENDFCLIAAVADGIGSRPKSQIGAQVACHVAVRCCLALAKEADCSSLATKIPCTWENRIREKIAQTGTIKDYATTCAFVCILKQEKKVIKGRIGDSFVAIKTDKQPVISCASTVEKDFLNETDCLGSAPNQTLQITSHGFHDTLRILLATDGIADEFSLDSLDGLFDYLENKFSRIKPKLRNHRLKEEVRQTFNTKNNDDKTLLFAWKNQ
jgi:serine/threonine protein phosphatase PrpC